MGYEEEYYFGDCSCSAEDESHRCKVCTGDSPMPMEEVGDEEDDETIDEDDDYDQDDDIQKDDGIEGQENKESQVKEKENTGGKVSKRTLGATAGHDGDSDFVEDIELVWHPRFRPNGRKCSFFPTITRSFVSIGPYSLFIGQSALCISLALMGSQLTISEVFKDMFSLPASNLNTDQSQPIFIDEKAEILALMIFDLEEHQVRTELTMRKIME